MKLLLLGGPKFLGRALIDAALAYGHEITLFNRGRTNPELYPEVEKLYGDRDHDLEALRQETQRGRQWDAVLDTCGYIPRIVSQSAALLAGHAAHYTFISSLSVYAGTAVPNMDERAPVGTLEDETAEAITGESYGPLKALCEQAVERHFPGRAFHVRAGLIVGPHDPSDRFTYWPWRVAQGGDVLAPATPDLQVQLVDVGDLASWVIRMAEAQQAGVYNATGPAEVLTLGEVLQTSRAVSESDATFTWVAEQFLLNEGVGPWMELPLWIPTSDPDAAGFSAINCDKAIAAGLRFRPLENTIRDTLAWAATRPADWQWRAGLERERELALLEKWHKR
jgi:2'-hydroxyisoflavone reductase